MSRKQAALKRVSKPIAKAATSRNPHFEHLNRALPQSALRALGKIDDRLLALIVNMDRGSIWRRLTQAEERISRGTEHVWKQREIVEKLERRGRNSDQARKVLKTFEDSLSAQQADHQRLLLEIEHLFLLGPATFSPSGKEN